MLELRTGHSAHREAPPYLSFLPSSTLPMASGLLGTARTGTPKRERSRGCSPGDLGGLASMLASSSFAKCYWVHSSVLSRGESWGRAKDPAESIAHSKEQRYLILNTNLTEFEGITKSV